MDDATIERVLGVWAADAAAMAESLQADDPSWRSEATELCGGRLVLSGAGLYVNRAMGCGLGRPLFDEEWRTIESRSAAIGVPAAIDVGPITQAGVLASAADRGYSVTGTVQALARGLLDLQPLDQPDPTIAVDAVDAEGLPEWLEVTAAGWGHVAPAARRASDAYGAAAFRTGGQRLLLARAPDGRPLGCAGLTVRDGVATLGAMSTLPAERRRGVQAALIAHRLRLAQQSGCDIATTTAVPTGDSQRNLVRHGFVRWFQLDTWTRSGESAGRPD